jgi:type VI secretion system Hcp family effector
MALNAYLHLQLDGVAVQGSVTQKGRENTIMVTSLEWSFDSDGTVGDVKFTAELDKETPLIGAGLKNNAVAEALFDFYQVTSTGIEAMVFTLNGTNGKVTSVNYWMMNNKDPNLMRYETTMQYTMSFQHIEQKWIPTSTAVTIP